MAPSKQKTSLKETISKFVSGVKDLAFFTGNFGKSSDKLPVFPEWFFTARIGQPRNLNVTEIRDFSKSAWVQMVLSTIKKEVTNTKWDLVKKDSEDETDYTNEIEEAKNFFETGRTPKDRTLREIYDLQNTKDTLFWLFDYKKDLNNDLIFEVHKK